MRSSLSAQERELGMSRDITRRDFIGAASLGAGAALLGARAPASAGVMRNAPAGAPWHPWTGFGGVGNYANSNGNTWEVVNAGHGIRDGAYRGAIAAAAPTGETYDLVIVGGGAAGVIAAYTFLKNTDRRRSCLILENHPLIGGEAKRNEFLVRGHRLIGPQGANGCGFPDLTQLGSGWYADMWRDIAPPGTPPTIEFARLPPGRRPMDFARDNFSHYANDVSENYGFFFDAPKPRWVTNMWGRGLAGTPWSEEIKRDMLRWREEPAQPFEGDRAALERWLDSMTYEDYLTKVRKLHPEVARYVDPFLASGAGLGSDALSAYVAWSFRTFIPGFDGLSPTLAPATRRSRKLMDEPGQSFPGGCDGTLRFLVKWLNPRVIEGSRSFEDVHNGRIRFEAMDQPGAPCRMRAGATVVDLVHDPDKAREPAVITYLKEGRLCSVRARTVIWAAGSWSGKHAVQRLPRDYHTAISSYHRSPMLVVNVALDNWRALYRLGYTVCTWRGGFGFTANLRAPMHVGDYRPPLDPDQPALFTLYVPFPQLGVPLADQGKVGRATLFATSYRDYEMQIRRQLVTLFANAGFDPQRDIAGIVLNRWGHAYINAGPGFFFGRDEQPTASEILRRPLGNLSFAHSEMSGRQTLGNAGAEGVRAAEQALTALQSAG